MLRNPRGGTYPGLTCQAPLNQSSTYILNTRVFFPVDSQSATTTMLKFLNTDLSRGKESYPPTPQKLQQTYPKDNRRAQCPWNPDSIGGNSLMMRVTHLTSGSIPALRICQTRNWLQEDKAVKLSTQKSWGWCVLSGAE